MYDGVLLRRTALVDLSPSQLRGLIRAGVLHRAFRGVYLTATRVSRASAETLRRAAMAYADAPPASASNPAYLCCQSAAAEWGLPVPASSEQTVGVPRRRLVARQPGLTIHRHDLAESAITTINGVRVVRRENALVQAFSTLPKDDRRQLLIRSVQRKLVSPEIIRTQVRRTTPHRRELLDLLSLAEAGGHSELEISAMSKVLVRYGVEKLFEQQYARALPGRHQPMDFAAVELKINLETDGSRYHLEPVQRRSDVRRDLDLTRHRWAIIRCQYENVKDEPERVAAAVLAEMLQRGWIGRPTTKRGRLLLATLRE